MMSSQLSVASHYAWVEELNQEHFDSFSYKLLEKIYMQERVFLGGGRGKGERNFDTFQIITLNPSLAYAATM